MFNTFYNELVQNDFFEKKASSNENIKSALGDITPGVLEKLAEEIGALCDQNPAVMTLEEKLASDESCEDKKDDCKEENKEGGCSKEAESEDEKSKEPDSEKEKDEESKEAEPEDEKSEESKEAEPEDEKSEEFDSKKEKDEESKEAESEDEKSKESDSKKEKDEDEEKEITKKAYELAQEKLAGQGYSIADYVFQKTASEEAAGFIAEYAEKLAYLSDRPALQVADHIIDSVVEKLA